MTNSSHLSSQKQRYSFDFDNLNFHLVFCCICLWGSSCIHVKEHVVIQKNGKGDFTLEWDMSAARLFSNSEDVRSAIEPAYLDLIKALENLSDIQLKVEDTHFRASSTQLSFHYKSLDALNKAMTLIYLGENQATYEFIKREGTLITRAMPPGVGEKLSKRWKTYWRTPFSEEEKAHVRWEGQLECKSTVNLVYSPIPAKINPDQHVVNWNLGSDELFGSSERIVKILTD